jgi:hypothetical protein
VCGDGCDVAAEEAGLDEAFLAFSHTPTATPGMLPPGCPPSRAREVLVSKPVADRIAQPGRLEPVGVVELKGVPQPLEVWR